MDKDKWVLVPKHITCIKIVPEMTTMRWRWVPETTSRFLWWEQKTPAHWRNEVYGERSKTGPDPEYYNIREEGGVLRCWSKPRLDIRLVCGKNFSEYYDTPEGVNDRVEQLYELSGNIFEVVK